MIHVATQPKTTLKFSPVQQSLFFVTAKNRVDSYFAQRNLSPHANRAMWQKAVFFLVTYVLLYGLILSNQFGGLAMLGFALLLGFCAAGVGFNVSHDAIHGAFSAQGWVNRLLSKSFYLLGANPYLWKLTHNVVHHTYTNIAGHDEDIELAPGLVRLDQDESHRPWQRFQHIYAFFLYGLTSLSWVFRKDYVKFFQAKIGPLDNTHHPRTEHINLFAYKVAYYVFFLVLPIVVLDLRWWQVLVGFMAMHITEGLALGLVFQLAHIVEGTSFPVPTSKGTIDEAWAIHQLQTTANFAPHSRLATFFCGGLNRQIEHHLFPKICHIHYPAIAPIVKQTASEYGLPYIENVTFRSALISHYQLLKQLGTPSGTGRY
ncbi:fatty acid desaturase family protein [Spirosoma validum]|uniref:Acyl-CoA desaturase n=1 Tax=Spirosoma validum TaxID=2771355 RepID=A0A927B2B4_9BACT|nr:acyl-CoA desaturase [Spirosoma validum]MBD2753942.1 acyl-CoA desaturase [Spirosoma validum]